MPAGYDLCGDAQSFYVTNSLHIFLGQGSNKPIGDFLIEKMADTMREVERSTARHVNVCVGSDNAVMRDMTYATDIYHVELVFVHKNSRNKPNCQTKCR